MENYNLIIELEVDPDREQSPAELRKILEKKQLEWSRIKSESHLPAARLRAETNLNNMKLYQAVLADEKLVKDLYAKARESVRKMREEAEKELPAAIDFYWKGTPGEDSLKALIQKFSTRGFGEKEIRDRVDAARPATSSGGGQAKKDIDFGNFEKLHKHLDAFGSPSIFDFLELPLSGKPSREALREASASAQSKYRSRGSSDPKNIAGKEIASFGMKIFGSEPLYQKYLDWLKELPVKRLIDSKLLGLKEISVQQYLTLLNDLPAEAGQSPQTVKQTVDKYLKETGKTANFLVDDPGASITCFCSQRGYLKDYTCPAGHVLFYKCSNCGVTLPRSRLTCVCGFDLNPLIRRIESAQSSGDWDLLAKLDMEDKVLDIDYFSTPNYQEIFSKVEAGLKRKKASAAKLDQQYQQFRDCVNRGDINGAFELWREEFSSRPDAAELQSRLSSFKPGKIKVLAVRDRGDKKILELKVPSAITHIGVKLSGQSEPSIYTVSEIRNMLEVNGRCSGVTLFGMICYAGKELRGEVSIQTFCGTSGKEPIPFELEWPSFASRFFRCCLTIRIKNRGSRNMQIPATELIGDFSMAVPYRKNHGRVLAVYGPEVLPPGEELSWEYPLKKIDGDLSVNLFPKDDTDLCFEPIKGSVLSHRL